MKFKLLLSVLIFSISSAYCQYNGKEFSFGVNGVYTTGAKIYLNPYSSDQLLRNYSFPLSDIINPAVDFRYRLNDDILFGFSSEYMKKIASGNSITVIQGIRTRNIEVNDGYILIPLEFSVYYFLPFSTERFKFLMGGGFGIYFGSQIRNFGDESVTTIQRKFAYGIQVAISMDYVLYENISIHSEMKFRDPQFIVTSQYDKQQVNYRGSIVSVAQKTFDSKINVDGVTFILGAAYMF